MSSNSWTLWMRWRCFFVSSLFYHPLPMLPWLPVYDISTSTAKTGFIGNGGKGGWLACTARIGGGNLGEYQKSGEWWDMIWNTHHGSLLTHSLELRNTPHWRDISFFIPHTGRHFKFSEVRLAMRIPKITTLPVTALPVPGWRIRFIHSFGVSFISNKPSFCRHCLTWPVESAFVLVSWLDFGQ